MSDAQRKTSDPDPDHGRRRGGMTRAEECERDCRLALREIEVAHAGYLLAIEAGFDTDRERLMREAHDKVRLAVAFAGDVLKRPAK